MTFATRLQKMGSPLARSFALPLAAALLAASSCANPTEVLVYADTTLGVPCQIDSYQIVIEGEETETIEASATGQESVAIVKGGGGDAFRIVVNGMRRGEVVATAFANASFQDYTTRQVVVTLTQACINTPCDFSDEVGGVSIVDAAERDSCDRFASRYDVQDQTGLIDIVNACDLGGLNTFQEFESVVNEDVQVDDENLLEAIADHDFYFYGEKVNRIWVADDGYLSFGDSPEEATFNRVTNDEGITSPGHPVNAVLPFWSNLFSASGGKICVAVQDVGDQDTLWISWSRMSLNDPTDNLTFSVGLEEGSNRIIAAFDTMQSTSNPEDARGLSAVVGIMGPDGPACSLAECSADGFCTDGVTECGYSQVFANEAQPEADWPAIYVFRPIVDTE